MGSETRDCTEMGGPQASSGRPRRRKTAVGMSAARVGDPADKSSQTAFQKAKTINTMICRASEHGTLDGVLNVVAMKHAEMSCVNLSTAIHKIARLVKEEQHPINPNEPRLKLLTAQIQRVLKEQTKMETSGEFVPRCWATIAWAYSTLQFRDAEVIQVLELINQLSMPHLHSFNPLELTNLLWAFARMQIASAQLFQMSCQCITTNLSAFSPSNLSTLVWAFVTAHQVQSRTLHLVVREFGNRLETSHVSPVEIANLMWGLATAKMHPKGRILHDIGCRALILLQEFKLQELSITAWAFSRLGVRHDELFAGITETLLTSPTLCMQIHSQGIANLLWAFERQKAYGSARVPQLLMTLQALLPIAMRLLPQLKPEEFTCVFMALTRFGLTWGDCHEADDLFVAGSRVGKELLHRLTVIQRLDLLEVFAKFTRGTDGIPSNCTSFIHALVQACFEKVAGLEVIGLQRIIVVAEQAMSVVSAGFRRIVLSRVAQLTLRVQLDTLPLADLTKLVLMSGMPSSSDLASLHTMLTTLAQDSADAPSQGYSCNTVPNSKRVYASNGKPLFGTQQTEFARQGKDCFEGFGMVSANPSDLSMTPAQQAGGSNHGLLMARLGVQATLQNTAACKAAQSVTRFLEPRTPTRHQEYAAQKAAPPLPTKGPVPKQTPDEVMASPMSEGGSLERLSMAHPKGRQFAPAEPHMYACSAIHFSGQPWPMPGMGMDTMEMNARGTDKAMGNAPQEAGSLGAAQSPGIPTTTSSEERISFPTRNGYIEPAVHRQEALAQQLPAPTPMPAPLPTLPSMMRDIVSIQSIPEAGNSGGGDPDFLHVAPDYIVKNTFVEPAETKPINTAMFLSEQPRRMTCMGMDLGAGSEPLDCWQGAAAHPWEAGVDHFAELRDILHNEASASSTTPVPASISLASDVGKGTQPSCPPVNALAQQLALPPRPTTALVHKQKSNVVRALPIPEGRSLDPLSMATEYIVHNTFVEPVEAGSRVCSTQFFSEQPRTIFGMGMCMDTTEMNSTGMDAANGNAPSETISLGGSQLSGMKLSSFPRRSGYVEPAVNQRENVTQQLPATPSMPGPMPTQPSIIQDMVSERSLLEAGSSGGGDLNLSDMRCQYIVKNTFVEPAEKKTPSSAMFLSEQPQRMNCMAVDLGVGSKPPDCWQGAISRELETEAGHLAEAVGENFFKDVQDAASICTPNILTNHASFKDMGVANENLSKVKMLASSSTADLDNMSSKHQAASRDLPRGQMLASKYKSEQGSIISQQQPAIQSLSKHLVLASKYKSDRGSMTSRDQALIGDLSRGVPRFIEPEITAHWQEKQKSKTVMNLPIPEGRSLDPMAMTTEYVVKNTFVEAVEDGPRVRSLKYFSEQTGTMVGMGVDTVERSAAGVDAAMGNAPTESDSPGGSLLPGIVSPASPERAAPFPARNGKVELAVHGQGNTTQQLQAPPLVPASVPIQPGTMQDTASEQPLPEAGSSGGVDPDLLHAAHEDLVTNAFVEAAKTKAMSMTRLLPEQPRQKTCMGLDLGVGDNLPETPTFIVKNTFIESGMDNNAAKAARLWASRFCTEQPPTILQ